MSDEDMARWVEEFYSTHPMAGMPATANAVPAETVFASNFIFNGDGDLGTAVDTVTILENESVLFQWLGGSHTTTSGTGPLDPEAGALWDRPLNSTSQQWEQVFPTEGIYPFFCRPHSGLMMGAVRVLSAVDVTPLPGRRTAVGFLAPPAPNPSSGRVSFRFALAEPGRVVAEVFDIRGRRVATVLDRRLEAGTFGAAWDGRTADGVSAAPGVYRLRLALPGHSDSRQIVLTR